MTKVNQEKTNTPDTVDVNSELHNAIEEKHPDPQQPVEDLFALDGLGQVPEVQLPLNSGGEDDT
jgi:hypothetical protein